MSWLVILQTKNITVVVITFISLNNERTFNSEESTNYFK